MKTKEELNELKEEVETVSKKLHELTEEELAQVSGGSAPGIGHEPGGFVPSFTITPDFETSVNYGTARFK